VRLAVPAGASAGAYPVTVTMSASGVRTLTRQVTVRLDDVHCAGTGSSCALDLAGQADLDGTATTSAPDSGNFDGVGWSFDADLLPAAGLRTLDGVDYQMPDPTGTAKNFVTAQGQQLAVPSAGYASLHVLGSAHGGDVRSSVTVAYTDGTTADVPFVLADWASSSPPAEDTVAVGMPHRIKGGQGVDGPPVAVFATTLALDPTRSVQSVTLPDDSRAEVYAMTFAR
jgi:hypothetical protein